MRSDPHDDHPYFPADGAPRRRGPLLVSAVVASALVVVCLAGWVAWQASGDSGDGGGGNDSVKRAAPAHSASPHASHSAAASGKKQHAAPKRPLAGRTVAVDPGHNIHNAAHTAEINRQVPMGDGTKECDTTGTETNSGYTEARFTLDVSQRLAKLLRAQGAKVVLTQDGNRPYGPCVDERARMGNAAHADAAVSIHADGNYGRSNRGFHVELPGAVHSSSADTRTITGPSRVLGTDIRNAFRKSTGSPLSNYLGGGTGLLVRTDLGGLNLSRVPKVLLECGNMRNAAEAPKFKDPAWRQHAAEGVADGIVKFLAGSGRKPAAGR